MTHATDDVHKQIMLGSALDTEETEISISRLYRSFSLANYVLYIVVLTGVASSYLSAHYPIKSAFRNPSFHRQ
jgi:hypothetical protein